MKKLTLALVAVLFCAVPALADDADEVVRSFQKRIPANGVDRIHLDFPVGEVEVTGWSEGDLDARLDLVCDRDSSRCRDAAQKVRFLYDTSGDELRLRVKDWPKRTMKGLHVRARISVPRALALRAELGVGELTVKGVESDLTADLGVGEVNITLPESAVGSVSLDTGIGEASLYADGQHYESAGLFVREVNWKKGTGRGRVEVDCGVGEINVSLK
jgi:hypothetical protein